MMPTTIDRVVRAAIAEAGYKNLRKYILFLHFAFDALYKLKRDNVLIGFQWMTLSVVNRRAVIPANVLALGQIGSERGQRIRQFIPDPNLSLDPAAQPSVWYPIDCGPCQGLRYRIDRSGDLAVIVFDRDPPTGVVYIEFIGTVDAPSAETILAEEGVLPMKSYIHFRNARFKLGAASAESKEAEKEFFDEMDEAVAGLSDLGPAYLNQALLRGNGLNLGLGYGNWYGHAFC